MIKKYFVIFWTGGHTHMKNLFNAEFVISLKVFYDRWLQKNRPSEKLWLYYCVTGSFSILSSNVTSWVDFINQVKSCRFISFMAKYNHQRMNARLWLTQIWKTEPLKRWNLFYCHTLLVNYKINKINNQINNKIIKMKWKTHNQNYEIRSKLTKLI